MSLPPRAVGWIIAMMCFGVALILVAVLMAVNNPDWF